MYAICLRRNMDKSQMQDKNIAMKVVEKKNKEWKQRERERERERAVWWTYN